MDREIAEKRRRAQEKINAMIVKKDHIHANGVSSQVQASSSGPHSEGAGPSKGSAGGKDTASATAAEKEEDYTTSDMQSENALIRPSSFGMRPLYSRVDINSDKWLLTMDEESRVKLENPPSLADGLDSETESELRYLGCELIQEAAILLKLPQTAAATGQILFQRYFFQRSFVTYMFEHYVMACLLLASKIEEEPRRPRDIYNVFVRLEKLHRLRHSGRKITKETCAAIRVRPVDATYVNAKNNMIKAERRLLSTLGFVVHVKHPHKLIISYMYILGLLKQDGQRTDIVQKAWSYMNDGLRTDMFLRYTPETIACACIFLAARTVQEPAPLPNQPLDWFELFDASDRDVKTIALMLLKLYTRKRIPNWPRLSATLDALRSKKEAEKKAELAAKVAHKITAEAEKEKDKHNGRKSEERKRRDDDRGSSRRRSRSRSRSRERRKRSRSYERKHNSHGGRHRHGRHVEEGNKDRAQRERRRGGEPIAFGPATAVGEKKAAKRSRSRSGSRSKDPKDREKDRREDKERRKLQRIQESRDRKEVKEAAQAAIGKHKEKGRSLQEGTRNREREREKEPLHRDIRDISPPPQKIGRIEEAKV